MNTKENTLLADFLGWEKEGFYFNLKTGNLVKKENDDCDLQPAMYYIKNGKPVQSLLFNSDWNWLMLVVEKIETDSRVDEFITKRCNTFNKYYCEIFFSFKKYRSVYTEGDNKITTVFNACIETVKELS